MHERVVVVIVSLYVILGRAKKRKVLQVKESKGEREQNNEGKRKRSGRCSDNVKIKYEFYETKTSSLHHMKSCKLYITT